MSFALRVVHSPTSRKLLPKFAGWAALHQQEIHGTAALILEVGSLLRRHVSHDAREFPTGTAQRRYQGQVCSREELLTQVWGYSFDPCTNVVDVYISRLRAKLGAEVIAMVVHAFSFVLTATVQLWTASRLGNGLRDELLAVLDGGP